MVGVVATASVTASRMAQRSGVSPEQASRTADALSEDPELPFGISGGKATISGRREFETGDLGSCLRRPTVDSINVFDVDMDHRRRKDSECPWAREAFAGLAEHDEAVVTEHQLVVRTAGTTDFGAAKLEPEAPLQVLDG